MKQNDQSVTDTGVGSTALLGPVVRKMNPDQFSIGERVVYQNHVTGQDLGQMEVTSIDADGVTCTGFFKRGQNFRFGHDGTAAWSCNLSIRHA